MNSQPKPAVTPVEAQSAEHKEAECAEFQSHMAERIGAGENLLDDPHLTDCERCQRLVEELAAIAQAARLLLPVEEEPHEDLWEKIQRAITHESA